jgi:hypothetical protein
MKLTHFIAYIIGLTVGVFIAKIGKLTYSIKEGKI